MDVDVSMGDVDVARAATGFVSSVAEGAMAAEGAVAVKGTVVDAPVKGTCPVSGLLRRRKKRIKRMMATINLNRS